MTLLTFQTDAQVQPLSGTGAPWARCNDLPELTSTVPREYVHRSSVAEVFLTGYRRIGDDLFLLNGQWPRAHTFFTTADGTSHDPVQAGETIRQAGLLLCHAEYGVPLGHNALLWNLGFKADPEQLFIGTRPTDLELIASCRDFAWKGNRFSGFLEVSIRRDGRVAATGTAFFSFVPPAVYRRLRGECTSSATAPVVRATPVPAVEAGRLLPIDVVLAPSGEPDRWLLSPHLSHPILFEHANDHHPAMVLVEAARQAAYSTFAGDSFTVTGIESSFLNYAELDAPCWIEAEVVPASDPSVRSVQVIGRQGDVKVFEALVSGTVPAAAGAGPVTLSPVTYPAEVTTVPVAAAPLAVAPVAVPALAAL
ncbi:ScbA/BarX family gamma-butyrolactone biosynthesis protein [Streptomyces sp. NPDC051130]|uniref:ScbA/BarX family gamma-butyrolactone biosynthesis protein n=1 Tax=Streptomyces sp. NPDC051130 TaxID=3157223 RepID=UPI00343B4BEB